MPQRQCSKCSREFPATSDWFAVRKGNRLASWCRPCKRALDLLGWCEKRRERLRERLTRLSAQIHDLRNQLKAKRSRIRYRNTVASRKRLEAKARIRARLAKGERTRVLRGLTLLLLAAFLVSCTQPPRTAAPVGFQMPPVVSAADALGSGFVQQAFASLLDGGPQPPVYGNVRAIYGRTSCLPALPASNPVLGGYTRPVVGREFVLKWHVEVLNPRPRKVSLLCSTTPPPVPAPLAGFGAPGCMLLVNPDFAMVPEQATTGLLTYSPASGVVALRWTPLPHMLGQRLTAQIIVEAPGVNQAGYLLGPAVEIIVGNQ